MGGNIEPLYESRPGCEPRRKYTKTCDNNGSGTFAMTGNELGLDSGVVLASGRVQNIPQAVNN